MTYYRRTSNAFYVAVVGEDMAHGKGARFFSSMAVAAVAASLWLAGCTTPVEQVAEAPGRSGQPSATGTYPNLNIPRHAAAAQLSDDETKAKLATLTAAQNRQGPGVSTDNAEARRRLQLSQDEQAETLKVIEGQ